MRHTVTRDQPTHEITSGTPLTTDVPESPLQAHWAFWGSCLGTALEAPPIAAPIASRRWAEAPRLVRVRVKVRVRVRVRVRFRVRVRVRVRVGGRVRDRVRVRGVGRGRGRVRAAPGHRTAPHPAHRVHSSSGRRGRPWRVRVRGRGRVRGRVGLRVRARVRVSVGVRAGVRAGVRVRVVAVGLRGF
jgi:hypothetical protein